MVNTRAADLAVHMNPVLMEAVSGELPPPVHSEHKHLVLPVKVTNTDPPASPSKPATKDVKRKPAPSHSPLALTPEARCTTSPVVLSHLVVPSHLGSVVKVIPTEAKDTPDLLVRSSAASRSHLAQLLSRAATLDQLVASAVNAHPASRLELSPLELSQPAPSQLALDSLSDLSPLGISHLVPSPAEVLRQLVVSVVVTSADQLLSQRLLPHNLFRSVNGPHDFLDGWTY